ncbi:MAG: zinc ABC transporter substrate-binding protein ZnuA [Nitratireductor sp.]
MSSARSLILAALLSTTAYTAQAEVKAVASIKPVHSLVAAVMEGVGEPGLIVDGAGSPHTYALKPSQAQMLENADVVFWVGHELEAFLEKPLETIGAKATAVELLDSHGLKKLGFREGGAFEKHKHEDGDDHDDHDHKAEAEHDHDDEETAEAEHEHEHEHGEFDTHVWLDPMNAKAMVHEIEEALVKADPENAAKYEANAEAVSARLDALIAEVSAELDPVKDKPFIVFHDAYQYFENRFGVTAAGSITVSPEVMPGAERVGEIRAKVQELSAACVFSEPQFEPKLVSTITEGTQAKSGVLDPLGAALDDGPSLYFEVIRNMANALKSCLSQAS